MRSLWFIAVSDIDHAINAHIFEVIERARVVVDRVPRFQVASQVRPARTTATSRKRWFAKYLSTLPTELEFLKVNAVFVGALLAAGANPGTHSGQAVQVTVYCVGVFTHN
jgi:hypothetical protein